MFYFLCRILVPITTNAANYVSFQSIKYAWLGPWWVIHYLFSSAKNIKCTDYFTHLTNNTDYDQHLVVVVVVEESTRVPFVADLVSLSLPQYTGKTSERGRYSECGGELHHHHHSIFSSN